MASNFEIMRKSSEDEASNDRLLQDGNSEFQEINPPTVNLRHKRLFLFGIGALTLVVLLQTITISMLLWQNRNSIPTTTYTTTSKISPGSILNCGNSPTQALAQNCIFDIMDYSWVPSPCYHASLSQHYLNLALSQNLTFFLSSSQSSVLPTSEILAGKQEYVFTTRLFHSLHCQYYLHRETSVLMDGLATSLMRNASYGVHCLKEVMEPGDAREEMFTGFHYERCAMGMGYLEPSARRRPKGKELGEVVDGGAGNDLHLPVPPV
ncbi:hypothetical protein IFR04_013320 [Cadophora malorum]|uniref:Uncharacterized protein n=1 Tax=Cadophora malorum TaxID=108018 RepID=A0A8H7T6V3_9HELO|nr:hypothetical protein IFR04_013320 [Cadophora malorum]